MAQFPKTNSPSSSTRALSAFEIGMVVQYEEEASTVVGLVNLKLDQGTMPFLVVTPRENIFDYLLFQKTVAQSAHGHGVAGYLDALLGGIKQYTEGEKAPFSVVMMSQRFDTISPTDRKQKIGDRVSDFLEAGKDFTLGSQPLEDDPHHRVMGRFLGVDARARPTVYLTLHDPDHVLHGTSRDKTIDYANILPLPAVPRLRRNSRLLEFRRR